MKSKKGSDALKNSELISFAEAKKLVIYPMLLAQFVGIVHEIKPKFLRKNKKYCLGDDHLHPALIALGNLTPNAKDILRSFNRRKYKIVVAENFDIRLSAAARAIDTSPFVGTISELLQSAASTQVSAGDDTVTSDVDFEDASESTAAAAVGRVLSEDEIPF